MAKKECTFVMAQKKEDGSKKGSVVFEAKAEDKPLKSGYFMREAMQEYFGVKKLEKVAELEVTVRIKRMKGEDAEAEEEEETDDEDEEEIEDDEDVEEDEEEEEAPRSKKRKK